MSLSTKLNFVVEKVCTIDTTPNAHEILLRSALMQPYTDKGIFSNLP